MALSVSLGHSPRPAWSCFCTTIAISARAAGTSAETSTRGSKSQTGVQRSPILRRAGMLIRRVSVCGARAMPADTLSCLAPRIVGCAASLPRFQRSVVTSRARDGFRLTSRPRWSMHSTRTREPGCAAIDRLMQHVHASGAPLEETTKAEVTRLVQIAREGNGGEAKPIFQKLFSLRSETVKQTAWGVVAR
jgi:hypothetical protein